jgi:predicted membrane protein
MSSAAASPGNGQPHGVYGALPRLFSLLAALGLSGWIFADPRAFAHAGHGLLTLSMLGVCAGFIHGVGFVPIARVWHIAFSPWLAWALMGLGLWLMLQA